MTAPAQEPIQEVLTELRELRSSFEAGIAAVLHAGKEVAALRFDLDATKQDAKVERDKDRATSTRRARWFRGMWALLAAASIAFFTVDRVTADDAARQQDCFQEWANATAHRSQTITAASEARISALDHVLDVRVNHTADSPMAKQAIAAAAAAGDTYEHVAAANPPIPPEQVFCTSDQEQPHG